MLETATRWAGWLAGGPAGDGFALTRWFAAVGALAIGLFAVGMGWLLSAYLGQRMLERDAEVSREFAQSIANVQQVAGFLRAPHANPVPTVAEFFVHVARMPDVLRANVYGTDQRVLWSSQPELIGRTFADNDDLQRALRGEVVVELDAGLATDTKGEHAGLAKSAGARFIESYLPLRDEAQRIVGVIELYREPVALFDAIAQGQRRMWLGALGGGALLLAVLVAFVRRTELTIRAQHRRLLEVQTLAQVGDLSAAVAHSIRNPLGSIRSSAELQREIDQDPQGVNGEIIRQVDRIEHLVRTLLTYAADPTEQQSSADLGAVLQEAALRFDADLRSQGKQLALDIDTGLGNVGTDPTMLAQVFNSLLANAAEATREGDHVVLVARRAGSLAAIEVRDNGSGIAPERLGEIFKPFATSKPRGLGLGLALARRIVERLGGEVHVRSKPDTGTRVRVTLPVS